MRRDWFFVTVALLVLLGMTPGAWGQRSTADKGAAGDADTHQRVPLPHPAKIEPLAVHSLLLDIINTGSRLVAVGARGHVLLSADGVTWRQVSSPTRATLTAVDFADVRHGWAVGWNTAIVYTDDGGETWELQNFQPELQKPLLDVIALGKRHALAVGAYGLIMLTRDGGRHWHRVQTPFDSKNNWHLNAVTRLRNGTLVVVGESGTIGYSVDGGETWAALHSPYAGPFFDVAAMGQRGVLVAGLNGQVYCTAAVGSRWRRVRVGTEATFMAATRLSNGRILLVGQGGTIRLLPADECLPRVRVSAPTVGLSAYLSGGALGPKGHLIVIGKGGVRNLGVAGPVHRHRG